MPSSSGENSKVSASLFSVVEFTDSFGRLEYENLSGVKKLRHLMAGVI